MTRFLIADAGSSKIHWAIIDLEEQSVNEFFTSGVNPAVMPEERISAIFANEIASKIKVRLDRVEFYGAGCKGEANCGVIMRALRPIIGMAPIIVESDMLGVCRALLGNESGVACILGTGANSCLYDGNQIIKNTPPGGYILGDEGSGAWLGNRLASDYIKGLLPEDIAHKFLEHFHLDTAEIIRHVYRPAPGEIPPNRFLASLTPFIKANIEHRHISGIVKEGFTEFFIRNISPYYSDDPMKTMPVNFAGSIAMIFAPQLKQIATELGYKIGSIIKNPMDALINRILP